MINQNQQRSTFRSLIIVASLLLTTTAVAADRGFYLGFSIGGSEINNPGELDTLCAEANVVCAGNETDTGLQGIFGYQFSHYVALEGTLFDLGDPAVSTEAPIVARAALSFRGGSLSLVPQLPLGDLATIYGKVGIVAGEAELTASVPSLNRFESDSTGVAGLVFGIGGAVNLGYNVMLRLGWERYSFDEALTIAGVDVDSPDIDLFLGTAIFRFGGPTN